MEIKFIADDPAVFEHYRPQPIKKFIPEWFKNIPKECPPLDEWGVDDWMGGGKNLKEVWPTIKACPPVTDFMQSGYVLFNVSETSIEMESQPERGNVLEYKYRTATNGYIGGHPHAQCPIKIGNKAKTYIKFNQPWKVVTPPGYSCLIYQPYYLFENRYSIWPGIVDTDKMDGIISLVGTVDTTEQFTVKPGDPLAVVFPYKRDEWKAVYEQDNPYMKSKLRFWLNHGYKTMFRSKKKYS